MLKSLKLRKYSALIFSIVFLSCTMQESQPIIWQDLESSPVLTPEESLNAFELQEGFSIELVASEPLIHDPVAIEFDPDGNLWVIEMMGYMPNIDGTLENVPNGTIKMLEDIDGDGTMDKSTIIIDSLILPRAMKLIYGGILYAEPPNLWFAKLENGHYTNKNLVDSTYAQGGNVEHQPNGLLLGLDNWIYSAKSSKRYKMINGNWIIEETEFRGQWGISQTDDGLLVYNTNSNQLRGDLISPSNIIRNPGIKRSKTTNIELVSNQKVYPIRPNTGINRGYTAGMLDSLGRLTSFTAACGPLIYAGHTFPQAFAGNGFVAEPSGNLIKRNILRTENNRIIGNQVGDEEFLASHDERFRPVNLYNGPDGNLYVVDMYRGIIQHITYLTNYLKNEINSRNLDSPVGLGRIYRIRPDNPEGGDDYDFSTELGLIAALGHPNRWVRLTSQRLLISIGEKIRENVFSMLFTSASDIQQIHGIWVLEGIGKMNVAYFSYSEEYFGRVLKHIIRATRRNMSADNYQLYRMNYERLLELNEPSIDLEISLALGDLKAFDTSAVFEIALKILARNPSDEIIEEALLSSMNNIENNIPEELLNYEGFSEIVSVSIENKKPIILSGVLARGSKGLYDAHCMTCHGPDGAGIQTLGPPLANSEWVNGDKDILISLVLVGFEGPIHVNNIYYQTPDIAPSMPGIRFTESLGNSNVAPIINYIRTHWGNDASLVNENDIQRIRIKYKDRQAPFTENELKYN